MLQRVQTVIRVPLRVAVSWTQLNWFSFRVLHGGSRLVLGISILAFVSGVGSLFFGTGNRLLSALLTAGGLLSILATIRSLLMRMFRQLTVRLFVDDEIRNTLRRLDLSNEYIDCGYGIARLKLSPTLISRNGHLVRESVARSPLVDQFIRATEIRLVEDLNKPRLIEESLRRRAALYEDVLRRKLYDSNRSIPHQRFYNGAKCCLANDLFPYKSPTLRVFRNGYYETFLTNELLSYGVETLSARPEVIYSGPEEFPAFGRANRLILRNLSDSILSNHIGVSTIVVTNDNQIVLWEQSTAAQHSHNRMAPTGSGSCDWEDWLCLDVPSRNLKALIRKAVEREFREESHPLRDALRDSVIATEVIGFFRWIRRGGKPEFVAVSKISKNAHELAPNVEEVAAPKHLKLIYAANSPEQLSQSMAELLVSELVSVPLWATVKCLSEMVEREPNCLDWLLTNMARAT